MMISDPRWTALDKSRRDELLDEYRDINIGFGERWWEDVDAQIREELTEIGITAGQIYFSGFWSQGDGAAIEGYVNNWHKVLTHLEDPHALARAQLANAEAWRFEANSTGRYCHSGTLRGDLDAAEDSNPFDQDEDPLRHHAWRIANPHVPSEQEIETLEKRLLQLFVERSDDAYKRLEAEYNYLTSDEVVVSYILEHCPEELAEDEDEEEGEIYAA